MTNRSILMTTQTVDRDHPILGFTHDWIAAIAARVDSLHVVTPRRGRVDLPANVTIHHLTGADQPVGTWANHLFHHRQFGRLIGGRQVTAVFVHMIPKWAIAAAPYCKIANVPLVLWYAHGHVPRTLRIAEKLVDRIVTSTPEGCRLDSPKLQIVGQGIDTAHFAPTNNTASQPQANAPFKILTVGRLSPVKNLERTVETMHHLVNELGCRQAVLQLVGGPARPGDDAYVAQLKTLIDKRELTKNVQFVGTRNYDSIVATYQQGNALLNLSNTNSLDKVALEAMACGLPVLSSNPAFQTLLSGVDSALFLPSSAPESTAVALKAIIQKPERERTHIGQQLRAEVMRDHNLDQLATRFVAAMEPHS